MFLWWALWLEDCSRIATWDHQKDKGSNFFFQKVGGKTITFFLFPGDAWVKSWRRRYKNHLSTRKATHLSKGAQYNTPHANSNWLKTMHEYVEAQPGGPDIWKDPSRIINADETAFCLDGASGKYLSVIAPRGRRNIQKICSGGRECLTTLLTVSADGHMYPPYIVLKGKGQGKNRVPAPGVIDEGAILGARYTCAAEGWQTMESFAYYIQCLDVWLKKRKVNYHKLCNKWFITNLEKC